jgi:hypothetical protein
MADSTKKYDNPIDQAFGDAGFDVEYVSEDEGGEITTSTFGLPDPDDDEQPELAAS